MDTFDLVIVGGGPAGYTAADLAAAAGMKTLLVERERLGGTCLNAGCIPSKALLATAKLLSSTTHAAAFGVQVPPPQLDMAAASSRMRQVVLSLRDGVAYHMDRRGVQVRRGQARLAGRGHVEIDGEIVEAAQILLAAGARAAPLRVPGADRPNVVDTTGALYLEHLPATMAVVGCDLLGVVLASLYSALGAQVTLVWTSVEFLSELDEDIRAPLLLELRRITIVRGAFVVRIEPASVVVDVGGMTREIPADVVVWCGERLPALDGLGLDSVALDVSGGRVRVDDHMRTSAPGVFAAGDITGESRWAHGAIRMAQVAVSTMLGTAERWRPQFQPTVLYTLPEAAWVGLTEEEARREGRPVRVAKLPMAANARFLTDTAGGRGLCKVVVDAETDLMLGVHLLSPSASEQIWGVLPLLEDELRASEIRELILPHPTMSEIIRDALAELR